MGGTLVRQACLLVTIFLFVTNLSLGKYWGPNLYLCFMSMPRTKSSKPGADPAKNFGLNLLTLDIYIVLEQWMKYLYIYQIA
jgi:hypothetical protein